MSDRKNLDIEENDLDIEEPELDIEESTRDIKDKPIGRLSGKTQIDSASLIIESPDVVRNNYLVI